MKESDAFHSFSSVILSTRTMNCHNFFSGAMFISSQKRNAPTGTACKAKGEIHDHEPV